MDIEEVKDLSQWAKDVVEGLIKPDEEEIFDQLSLIAETLDAYAELLQQPAAQEPPREFDPWQISQNIVEGDRDVSLHSYTSKINNRLREINMRILPEKKYKDWLIACGLITKSQVEVSTSRSVFRPTIEGENQGFKSAPANTQTGENLFLSPQARTFIYDNLLNIHLGRIIPTEAAPVPQPEYTEEPAGTVRLFQGNVGRTEYGHRVSDYPKDVILLCNDSNVWTYSNSAIKTSEVCGESLDGDKVKFPVTRLNENLEKFRENNWIVIED